MTLTVGKGIYGQRRNKKCQKFFRQAGEKLMNLAPPHNLDAEREFLGSIITEASHFERVKGKIYPSDFYHSAHQQIFQAIKDLDELGEPINLLTLNDILQKQGLLENCGGAYYLHQILDNVIAPSNIESHGKLIREASGKRSLYLCLQKALTQSSAGENAAQIVEKIKQDLTIFENEFLVNKEKDLGRLILDVDEFCQKVSELPTRQTILNPWLKENSIVLISGWRGTGKTWFALGLLDAITGAKPFGPWQTLNPVPCLFLDGEMPAQDIKERISSLGLTFNRQNPLYIMSDALANQCGLPRVDLTNETWRSTLKRLLTEKGIKLWVLDNIASLASGIDENVKKDWDPINQWLLELRFSGISTIMLHHVNKEGGQRGTSAREDNLDISITIKAPQHYNPEDGAMFVVHFTKSRVSTKDLKLISEVEFHLIPDEAEQHQWIWKNLQKVTKKEILKMLNEGVDYSGIKGSLNICKSYITKVKHEAINKGRLNQNGKLTGKGHSFVFGNEE
jgi:replicative DNA helicase